MSHAAAVLAAAALAASVAPAARAVQDTVRVSVDSTGAESDAESFVSARAVAEAGGGLLVVFTSAATDLVPGDGNAVRDVFLHDVAAGTTERIVFDASGGETDGASFDAHVTPDGRFVAFSSVATGLVKGDTNDVEDVFVLDRKSGVVERVSVADDGSESDAPSFACGISDDGNVVAFFSGSDLLVKGDSNSQLDVFVRDRKAKRTICVSRNAAGTTGDGSSFFGSLSADGDRVAFASHATDLVGDDGNGLRDAFVHDRTTSTTTRASLNPGGIELDAAAEEVALSRDGHLVAFTSAATNAHRDATNGKTQVFVTDLRSGELWLASRGLDGVAADFPCFAPSLFVRHGPRGPVDVVAFWSSGSNLPDAGSIADMDGFAVDFRSGTAQCINLDSDGVDSFTPRQPGPIAASPDGRHAAFVSKDDLIVAGDGNAVADVFLRGLQWRVPEPFGDGLAGTGGFVPRLTGIGGSCEAGHSSLAITDGFGGAPGLLWIGLGRTSGIGLFGGTFYVDFAQPFFAVPVVLDGPAGIGGTGELSITGANVEDVGGFSLYLQCTILDARAVRGVSLSNALELAIDA